MVAMLGKYVYVIIFVNKLHWYVSNSYDKILQSQSTALLLKSKLPPPRHGSSIP